MKRFYHNMTNEVKTYRTWILKVESVGEADFKWLNGFNMPIRIENDDQWFDTPKGRYKYQGKRTYTVDTWTDKQRDMLVLKYGNDAVLIQEEHVLPGTVSTCTLSNITW
jgi:hypothetical protein